VSKPTRALARQPSLPFNEFDVASVEFIRCDEQTLSPLTAQLAEQVAKKIVKWMKK
jgi:hypothetical protein